MVFEVRAQVSPINHKRALMNVKLAFNDSTLGYLISVQTGISVQDEFYDLHVNNIGQK